MQSPATLALMMKQELGLGPKQVEAVEALARAERDSNQMWLSRVMSGPESARSKERAARTSWTGPIDETKIRAAACEQARRQADLAIGIMRERHALGAVLSADQRRQYEQLQPQMVQRLMRDR